MSPGTNTATFLLQGEHEKLARGDAELQVLQRLLLELLVQVSKPV